MYNIAKEIQIWNTPLIGSYLLWCFTEAYTVNHKAGESPPALLHFIVSAILSDSPLTGRISNKRPNLRSYVKSFSDKKDVDRLLTIHSRVIEKRAYTLSAIDLAITQGLLVWSADDARIYPKELNAKPQKGSILKPNIQKLGNKAKTLGKWFSKHELSEISLLLKVVF